MAQKKWEPKVGTGFLSPFRVFPMDPDLPADRPGASTFQGESVQTHPAEGKKSASAGSEGKKTFRRVTASSNQQAESKADPLGLCCFHVIVSRWMCFLGLSFQGDERAVEHHPFFRISAGGKTRAIDEKTFQVARLFRLFFLPAAASKDCTSFVSSGSSRCHRLALRAGTLSCHPVGFKRNPADRIGSCPGREWCH